MLVLFVSQQVINKGILSTFFLAKGGKRVILKIYKQIIMKKVLISVSTMATMAAFSLAQGATIIIGNGAQQGQVNGGALIGLLNLAQQIVSRLGIFAVGVALLAFFWYLIKFIMNPSPENKTQSLRGMGYAILALFVMVSIWGIIGLLGSIFGINQGGSIPVPGIPVPS
jgi:hypothetical protein